jgi:hypothetical protein
MIEPILTKFRGRCLVRNILTASGKQFNSLPRLNAYLTGICWLHAIATCPYGSQCSFVVGNVKKGNLSDAHANAVVGAMQEGVTAFVNKSGPPSPTGNANGGDRVVGVDLPPPRKCDWKTQSHCRGGKGGAWTLLRGG